MLKGYLRPHWGALALSLACAALVGALSAVLSYLLEPTVRRLFIHPDPRALVVLPLTIAGVGVARGLLQLTQAVLTNRIGNGLVADLQAQLFGHLLRADLARLRGAHTGAYVSSVLYDAGLIREAATSGLVNYTQNILTVIGAAVVMLIEDSVLALFVVVAAPATALVMRRFVKRTRGAALQAMEETSAPSTDTLMTMVTAAILAYAGWRALHGGGGLPHLIAFMMALALGSQALRFMANYQTVLTEGLAAAERLFQALDIEPEITDRPGAAAIGRARGEIAFEDVRFAYGENAPALEGVSFTCEAGTTVALVGPSGGGKSTILNLIPRFYEVGAGRIALDGRDIRELTLKSLRDQIGLVTQEPFLFDDTVRANIAYARPDAAEAQIVQAARAAAADDFIRDMPGGYDAPVGEAGARLSGGQRQRIAIARAFLKDAPILLLDEATSALDTESEAKVQEALARLMQGRTTLLIAHRLSTVRSADVIHVIDRGRVVETGAHEELTRQGGLYARLSKTQNLEAA